MSAPLRLVTDLAPGLPLALFEGVAAHLARTLGCAAQLTSETTCSTLEPAQRSALATALLGMHEHEEGRRALASAGVRCFAPVSTADYEPERRWLGRNKWLASRPRPPV